MTRRTCDVSRRASFLAACTIRPCRSLSLPTRIKSSMVALGATCSKEMRFEVRPSSSARRRRSCRCAKRSGAPRCFVMISCRLFWNLSLPPCRISIPNSRLHTTTRSPASRVLSICTRRRGTPSRSHEGGASSDTALRHVLASTLSTLIPTITSRSHCSRTAELTSPLGYLQRRSTRKLASCASNFFTTPPPIAAKLAAAPPAPPAPLPAMFGES